MSASPARPVSLPIALAMCLAAGAAPAASPPNAFAPTPDAAPAWLTAALPPRNASAETGSQVLARVNGLDRAARERAFVEQVLAGNLPDFLRELKPIEMDRARSPARAVVWVMPDYLAVGSNEDFARIPLGLDAAARVARRLGFVLPTRRMVDRIHAQASCRLSPRPMPPGPEMTTVPYLRAHERTVAEQTRGLAPGTLLSGHKKDVVLTPRLATAPGRVAIYGWHRAVGRPIQPLSTVHGAAYADYSHGIRLVSAVAFLDGEPVSVFDCLEDPELVGLVSDEGVDLHARRLLAPRLPVHGAAAPSATAHRVGRFATSLQQRKPRW